MFDKQLSLVKIATGSRYLARAGKVAMEISSLDFCSAICCWVSKRFAQNKFAVWLAQLGERWSAIWEDLGANPAGINSQGPPNFEDLVSNQMTAPLRSDLNL